MVQRAIQLPPPDFLSRPCFSISSMRSRNSSCACVGGLAAAAATLRREITGWDAAAAKREGPKEASKSVLCEMRGARGA